MRKHRFFLAFTLLELAALLALVAHGRAAVRRAESGEIPARREVVRRLGLTDLSLWTEARYTRHPSQADLHSAFQDHPTALEHFPTGSIAGPPAGLRRHHGKLD